MFNLFKSKNPKNVGIELSNQSTIETIYEQGKISGLLIIHKGKANYLLTSLKNKETLTEFMKSIEDKIKKNDFLDTRPLALDDFFPHTEKESEINNAKRAVVSNDFKPVFSWKPN